MKCIFYCSAFIHKDTHRHTHKYEQQQQTKHETKEYIASLRQQTVDKSWIIVHNPHSAERYADKNAYFITPMRK